MDIELRILILEDVPADAELMERELNEAGIKSISRRVVTEDDFVRAIEEFGPNMIFTDYTLPAFDGLSALNIAKEKCPDIPLIFVTGTMGEDTAIETLKKGATDYVLKGKLSRLVPAVKRALEEATEKRRRKEAEEALRGERQTFLDILEAMSAYVVLLTPQHRVTFANRSFRERFGEPCGKICYEYLFNRNEPCEMCKTYKVLETMEPIEWEWTGPDGHIYYIYDFPITDADGSAIILEMGIDITDRKRAEGELRQKVDELERFRSATVQREFRVRELKDRVRELEKKLEEADRSSR